mgnify:CR=1 FL=1
MNNKLNILFLYSNVINPIKGGIQNVTYELSGYFTSKGNSCYYISLNNLKIDDKKQYYLPNASSFLNNENKNFLINFIKEKNIDIVINQGGFDKDCCKFAYIAKQHGVKLISCLHNSLLERIRNFETVHYNSFKKYNLLLISKFTKHRFVKKVLYSMYRLKYKKHFEKLHEYSDLVVLLSDSFKQDLSFFIGNLSEKVCAMPNPIPSKIYYEETNVQKEKIVLYVGRIDIPQKRPDLLLEIWSTVYKKHKDWNLVIVGDGKDLDFLKKYAKSLQLYNIYFEGQQDPTPYYKKASIFCMTSAYEGFGIVLIEAMNMKVVPIAFESFSTVKDIIDNNINGVLVEPFNNDLYSKKLSELMENDCMRLNMSNNAYKKSEQFQLNEIGEKWLALFSSLVKN